MKIAAALLAVTGCLAQHVPLQAPAPNASPDERTRAYAELAPAAEHTTVTVTATGNAISSSESTSLILRNGQTINDPTDLIPVVPTDSPTARAATRADDNLRTAKIVGVTSTAVAIGGLVALLADGFAPTTYDKDFNPMGGGLSTVGWVSIGAMAVGAIGILVAGGYGMRAHQEQIAAFATYDQSLRTGLRMCVDQLQIVACP